MSMSVAPERLEKDQLARVAAEVANEFAHHAVAADVAGDFLPADLDALRASGLLGMMAPERLGGTGATFAEYARRRIDPRWR